MHSLFQRDCDTTAQTRWDAIPFYESPSLPLRCGENGLYHVGLASSAEDIKAAQRLRYDVFSNEFGAVFSSSAPGLDQDEFDGYCDHLIVRVQSTMEIVGTYRILLPQQAARLRRYYSQNSFYMTRLERRFGRIAELGRSCVHPDHRTGAVIMQLWSGIARYLRHHSCSHLIGSASVSMRDGGAQAAALWHQLKASHLIDPMLEAFPKNPLDFSQFPASTQPVRNDDAPLIRAYIRIGAKVCGEPSWDPDFNTADFLMLLDLSNMTPSYARRFGI